MKRYLTTPLEQDVRKKMVLLTGPRQVGKTTLARSLGDSFQNPLYLNYDTLTDRPSIERAQWLPTHDYLVIDELHNMPHWKPYLKGIYDSKPANQALLITGSARLDTFRQTGESLAGRYFRWHLFPFSVKELAPQTSDPELALDALLRFGGFPEALFEGTDSGRKRWQNQYYTDLIREDVVEFSRIQEVRSMRNLVELLRGRTGSPLSFESLSRDLGIAPNTVRNYVEILEALHIVFLVRPFHRNIARAQAKAAKLYFYDWAYVQGDDGARLENLVATSLQKHVHYLADSSGEQLTLNYLRTTSGKEVDFVLTQESGDAVQFIEVKWADMQPSYALKQMAQQHPQAQALQLVRLARHATQVDAVQVHPVAAWLMQLAA
jgi:predicted AAA+ superfamily ATPase